MVLVFFYVVELLIMVHAFFSSQDVELVMMAHVCFFLSQVIELV